jgi:hypothetical protein
MRMIKVRALGSKEVREVTFQEAERILDDIYNSPIGGLVADARTREVIFRLSADIDQIIVLEQMLGGG